MNLSLPILLFRVTHVWFKPFQNSTAHTLAEPLIPWQKSWLQVVLTKVKLLCGNNLYQQILDVYLSV
jgi:hypothetical protein